VPDYAVIALGGKQYKVRTGEHLLVDRLEQSEGDTFSPTTLATGDASSISDGGSVTARVTEHVLGEKILIRTYKPKKMQSRRKGHRSRLSRIVIESIAA
jgi:large subunit ribosomal protein L21